MSIDSFAVCYLILTLHCSTALFYFDQTFGSCADHLLVQAQELSLEPADRLESEIVVKQSGLLASSALRISVVFEVEDLYCFEDMKIYEFVVSR